MTSLGFSLLSFLSRAVFDAFEAEVCEGGWVCWWVGVCAAVLYHLQLLAVGLTGSVPLQQLFDGGLHTDTLVHPRLVVFWIKRRSSHSAHVYQAVGDNNRH